MKHSMIRIGLSLFLLSTLSFTVKGQSEREIVFPDVPGFKTLKCDLHIHTVFSDGSVWPNIRVQEAIKDGLDAISITDHIEYQPHLDDIPHPDRNKSYRIALEAAKGSDLLIIHGTEITRDMPPGHANAVFIEDVNKINVKDSVEAYRQTKAQNAFVFWNHPNWTSQREDGIATLTPLHEKLMEDDMLHGIEVANDVTYSDEALQIALDHNLTIIGTSDIHGLIDWQYDIPRGGHRPVTLVFAKDKSLEGIREGLDARRTVAWFDDLLIGREEHIMPLIDACVQVESATYSTRHNVLQVTLKNSSDATFQFENKSEFGFHRNANLVTIPAHSSVNIYVKTKERLSDLKLAFRVLNAITAPNTNPEVVFNIKPKL